MPPVQSPAKPAQWHQCDARDSAASSPIPPIDWIAWSPPYLPPISAYRRHGYSMRYARGRVPNHRGDGQFRTAEVASDAREGAAQHEWRDTLKPCHGADAVERPTSSPNLRTHGSLPDGGLASPSSRWTPCGHHAGNPKGRLSGPSHNALVFQEKSGAAIATEFKHSLGEVRWRSMLTAAALPDAARPGSRPGSCGTASCPSPPRGVPPIPGRRSCSA